MPEAKVVKAFNNINFRHLGELARPEHADARTSLVIAGDDDSAKAEVRNFSTLSATEQSTLVR
ncbi:hypothetical protein AY547_08095 [Corynebacterium diphtheriae bv. gravis]|nr:hypothetical protein AL07_01600 [Corynebacterium diphtheriae bv. gravis str. ISS 4060]OWN00267.1 hypothetical protein AY476_08950 [Corynebacterium diphtheriae bv. mitis]OWN10907.1 hypothetical protein AY479_08230 [Corynebacterium belfantii]OWN29492.1 hypothetical protein AY503_08350 [Corynebacterium diphtheriae bv. gravis]CAB0536192.1 hypothetical protein CIP107525_00307 [Corynebacterium diphtheriae]